MRRNLHKIKEIEELYDLARSKKVLTYNECKRFEEIAQNLTRGMIQYSNCCDEFRDQHRRILFSLNMAMFFIAERPKSRRFSNLNLFPEFELEELRELWDIFCQSKVSILEVYKKQGESTRRVTKQLHNCLYGDEKEVYGPGFFKYILELTASFDDAATEPDTLMNTWFDYLDDCGDGMVKGPMAHPYTYYLAGFQKDFLHLLHKMHNYGHKHLYKIPHANIGFHDGTHFLFTERSKADVVGFDELDQKVFEEIDAVLREVGNVKFDQKFHGQGALPAWPEMFRNAIIDKFGGVNE